MDICTALLPFPVLFDTILHMIHINFSTPDRRSHINQYHEDKEDLHNDLSYGLHVTLISLVRNLVSLLWLINLTPRFK